MSNSDASRAIENARALIKGGSAQSAIDMIFTAWTDAKSRPAAASIVLASAYQLLGQTDAAGDVLAQSVKDRPGNASVREARARWLLRNNRNAEALEILKDLPSDDASKPRWELLRARALTSAGRVEESLATTRSARARWPENSEILGVLAENLCKTSQFDECIAVVEPRMRNPAREYVEAYRHFVRACMIAGEFAKLNELLPNSVNAWPDPTEPIVHAVAASCAVDRTFSPGPVEGGRPLQFDPRSIQAATQDFERLKNHNLHNAANRFSLWLVEVAPSVGDFSALRARALHDDGDVQGSLGNYRHLLKTGALQVPQILAFAKGLWQSDNNAEADAAYSRAIAEAKSKEMEITARLRYSEFLISLDRRQDALKQLRDARARESDGSRSQELAFLMNGALGRHDPDGAPENGNAPEVFEDGTVTHYRASDRFCFVWFGGIIPGNIVRHLTYLRELLAPAGVSVLAVNDTKRLGSVSGFGRYFPSWRAAAGGLQKLIAKFGYVRVVTGGNSLAGFSAVLYGCEIGAAGTLSFSAPSYIPAPENILDKRGVASLRRVLKSANLDVSDLREVLADRPNFVLHQNYGADSPFDADQAEHLRGLSCVRLFGDRHADHASMDWLHGKGLLEERVKGFLASTRLTA